MLDIYVCRSSSQEGAIRGTAEVTEHNLIVDADLGY
jgi:hypothetical protein